MNRRFTFYHKIRARSPLNRDPKKKVLSTRWVFTEKPLEDGVDPITGGLKAKARLVVKGFMDPEKGDVATDSPTMRREYLRILAFLTVQCGFVPGKYDIKTAFLNAKMPRDLQIASPPNPKSQMVTSGKSRKPRTV